jgi:hypothetical protein
MLPPVKIVAPHGRTIARILALLRVDPQSRKFLTVNLPPFTATRTCLVRLIRLLYLLYVYHLNAIERDVRLKACERLKELVAIGVYQEFLDQIHVA